MARAIWGQGHKWRGNEIVFTFISRGHLVDPLQVGPYQAFTTLRRMLLQQPSLQSTYQELLAIREDARMHRQALPNIGPVAQLLYACDRANITLESEACTTLIHLKEGDLLETMEMPLLEGDTDKFKHTIRQCLRQEMWDDLWRRRPLFSGAAETGFDRSLSMHLYNSGKLCGLRRYRLRCILTGAVATQARLARNQWELSPICPCFGLEDETQEHLFLRCPAHQQAREGDLVQEYFQGLPACMKIHGLIPVGFPLPADFALARDDQLDLAYRLQYTLIGILESRDRFVPSVLAPRWDPR